jgi:pimeloyl-ACP methyl ester carboxylesterase
MNNKAHSISTKDGREISVAEAGHSDGVPIIVHHGTPGSRLLYSPWIQDAEKRGIRLIGYDRPGYGGSTPLRGRSVASAAEDVAVIAKFLQIESLCVWGISGGGPHALACAALLPDLVLAAAILASPAPYPSDNLEYFEGMGEGNIDEFNAALAGRDALERYIEPLVPDLLSARDPKAIVEEMRSLLCPPDVAVIKEDYAKFLIDSTNEGIEARRDGWIDDDIAFFTPWGFTLSQIQVPILLLHGEQDQMVPVSHGKWLASELNSAEASILPDDGHLTLKFRIPEVHNWLLDKIR